MKSIEIDASVLLLVVLLFDVGWRRDGGVASAFQPCSAKATSLLAIKDASTRALFTAFPYHKRYSQGQLSELSTFHTPMAQKEGQRLPASVLLFALQSLDDATSSTSSSSSSDDTEPTTGNGNSETIMYAVTTSLAPPGDKLRRLKDMMWVRECLEDLTAAEFACTVEAMAEDDEDSGGASSSSSSSSNSNSKQNRPKRSRKRAVDYEKLLTQLNKRIRDLGCDNVVSLGAKDVQATDDFQCVLEPGTGMGCLTYTDTQRAALLERLTRTRIQLIQVIHGNKIDINSENLPFLQMQIPALPRMEIPKEEVEDALSPKLYVRDDGTVDWDGALTTGAALRQFGTAVWARINGRDADAVHENGETSINGTEKGGHDNSSPSKAVTVKIVETQQIIDARKQLEILNSQLVQMEKEHYKLLNSAISQGQATANVKLAMLNSQLRGRIQASSKALENVQVRVSFQTLVYEMERIYTYLLGELGNPALNGYIPLQDRLNVAEFGLLESQVDSFNRQFLDNEIVDEDVLAVVFEQLSDFKRRLGIDYYVAGLSFDREAIGRWLNDLWGKTKNGLAFYVKGVRLFWNDVVFCLRLINRAAQGYTLKPREVRTIR